MFNDAALDAVLLSYFANTSNAKTSNADNSVPDADVDVALEAYKLHQLKYAAATKHSLRHDQKRKKFETSLIKKHLGPPEEADAICFD